MFLMSGQLFLRLFASDVVFDADSKYCQLARLVTHKGSQASQVQMFIDVAFRIREQVTC